MPAGALFRLDGPAGNPAPLLLGYAADGNIELVADVIREWIAVEFGQSFEPSGIVGESSLATEAFYDEIGRWFGDRVFVAALHLPRPNGLPASQRAMTSGMAARALESVDELRPITWAFQGLVHVFFDRKTGKAQVTLDDLPGALTFDRAASSIPPEWSDAADSARLAEASTPYAFGWAEGSHSEVLVTLRNKVKDTAAGDGRIGA